MLGDNIKRKLQALGMQQKELADRAGITDTTMSRYVNNQRVPSGPVLAKIAGILECSVEELLKDDNSKKLIDVSDLTDEEIAAVKVFIRCMMRSRW